jgi:hypothetical protein
MAKKANKASKTSKAKNPKRFLTELATNPEKLGKFIKAPDKMMREAGIPKEHMDDVRNAVAHSVHRKLTKAPNAFTMVVL